jgi:DNA polymerase III alpha subunit
MDFCTTLKDRVLWYDGDSTVNPHDILRLSAPGKNVYVSELTDDMRQYNRLVSTEEQIKTKDNVREFDMGWNIPAKFKSMDVNDYVYDKLFDVEKSERLNHEQSQVRMKRVATELALFKKFELYDVLRTIIYVIDVFRNKNVVWGVGRGSSVASYVLYLIGVHDIDSVQYGLDINEFLH